MTDRHRPFEPPDERLTAAYAEEAERIAARYPANGTRWQRFQRARRLRLLRRRMMDRSRIHG